MDILKMFLFSYIVTVAVETAAALIWKIRDIKLLAGILLVNTITNPLAVMSVFFARIYLSATTAGFVEIVIEIAVFLAEAFLFGKVMKLKHPILLSLTLNAASYCVGLVINLILQYC